MTSQGQAPRILFFGRLREAAGAGELAGLPASVRDFAALHAWIAAQNPVLAEALAARGVRIVLNNAFLAGAPGAFADGDEIAFVPALSGG